jgi:PHD/YefM family antitoxin component YafN of YafNO toxin-antitoxin module
VESPDKYGIFAQASAHSLLHKRLAQFIKLVKTVRATNNISSQPLPDVLLMDAAEFEQQMAELENRRSKNSLQMA